jgi:hypothetical protein
MPSPPKRPRGKRGKLQDWLAEHRPERIGEAEWAAILKELAPVSGSYLRRLLREADVELAPMIEGVRQEDFAALERTLLALASEYEVSGAEGRGALRRLVIEAKDHAKWASRKSDMREEKEEMSLWMRTWLENPPIFGQWVRLRQHSSEPVDS